MTFFARPPGGGCATSRVDFDVVAPSRRRQSRRAMIGLTPRRRKTARFGVVVDVRDARGRAGGMHKP